MNSHGLNSSFPLVVILSFGLLAGCGGESVPTGTVEGTLKVDGKPYSDASIVFMSPENGHAASTVPQADGSFEIVDPLPTGEYVIYLAPKPVEAQSEAGVQPVTIDQTVPEQFWNETSTTLKATINEGANTVPVNIDAQ